MYHRVTNFENSPLRASIALTLFAALLCGHPQVFAAQTSTQTEFASPQEASNALFAAVESQDTDALTQILGQSSELISSHDTAQDQLERKQFIDKYKEMHRLVGKEDGERVLAIGAENWPFPIPLVSRGGMWRYDADAGKQEILYRRVGANEIAVIDACNTLATPILETRDDAGDPVQSMLTTMKAGKPVPFQGYYFRILPHSGDRTFAAIAYPAVYGSSGVMTFLVDHAGVVHEKDLGPSTGKIATAMHVYPTDSTWTIAITQMKGRTSPVEGSPSS
jgi:hypothetical protein